MIRNGVFRLALAIAAACMAFQRHTAAQVYKTIYTFSGGSDGAYPSSSLIQGPGGALYGMTPFGGKGNNFAGNGVLFSFDPATNVQTVLHTFVGGPDDGAFPNGALTRVGDILYGMTTEGGQVANNGTIFTFNPATGATTILHSFAGNEGAQPHGSLTQFGGNLFGMTTDAIFSFAPGVNTVSTIHTFAGVPTDGAAPQGSVLPSGQTLYGMSQLGGWANLGALFSFDLSTNKQTLLHSFTGGTADGPGPRGSLIQSGNLLYGMTLTGGASNLGTIFSYDLTTGTETVLHSFAGGISDGANPFGSLIQSGNTLYGMTRLGGSGILSTDSGVVFAFDLSTNSLSILHTFTPSVPVGPALSTPDPNASPRIDGSNPNGDLLLAGSTLYGMTEFGTANGAYGTIFSITLPEPSSLALLAIGALAALKTRRPRGSK